MVWLCFVDVQCGSDSAAVNGTVLLLIVFVVSVTKPGEIM